MSNQKFRILFITISIAGLFLGALVFAVTHPTFFEPTSKDTSVESRINSSPTQVATSTARGPIQNVRFTVYDQGIYPRQLRARSGVVAITLEDRTQRRPRLVVERETLAGALPLGAISFLLDKSRTRSEFRLDVGRYRVSDATKPTNQAELTVEK